MKNLNCLPFLFTTMQQIFHYNNHIKIKIPFEKVLNSSQFCHCYKSIWNITIHFKFKLISPFIESPKYMGGPYLPLVKIKFWTIFLLSFWCLHLEVSNFLLNGVIARCSKNVDQSGGLIGLAHEKKMCTLLTGQESTVH